MFILNNRDKYESAGETAEELSEWLRQEEYDMILDTVCEPFIICGTEIEAAFILKRDSLGTYLQGFYEWVSEQTEEFRTMLEGLSNGDNAVIKGTRVECVADEDQAYDNKAA